MALALGEKLLGMHATDDEGDSKKRTLIENLSRKFHSHNYPVSRSEAIDIGLPVNKERDDELESLVWKLWLDLENELKEREPFSPIIELLNSSEGHKILSAVPQWDLPGNAPNPIPAKDDANTVDICPVDFETVEALIESPRLAFKGVRKGKILASRLPDLGVQLNVLVTFRGWETMQESRT